MTARRTAPPTASASTPPSASTSASAPASGAPAGPRYRAAAAALLRVPALPADRYAEALTAGPDGHRAFLDGVLALPHAEAALRHAAPDLWAALRAPEGLGAERTALAVDRYVNRMSTRPTPFGLTAAVAGVPVGEDADAATDGLRLAGPPVPWPRPDARDARDALPPAPGAAWDDDELLVTAALAHTVDGHLWLAPAARGRARWLRGTAPARAVLDAAALPVPAGTLAAGIADRFGTPADPAPARTLVTHLLRQGFLRPAPSSVNVAPSSVNVAPSSANVAPSSVNVETARSFDAVARLAPGSRLPAPVARLAQEAAGLLAVIGRGSRYPRELAHAAAVFAARYGDGAWVPAPEAVHVLTAERALYGGVVPPAAADARETVLAGVVAAALAYRRPAREIDDVLLARLAEPSAAVDAGRPPLPAAEICLRPARDADGRWWAALTGPVAVPAGTVHGRFTDLLDPATRTALREAARAEEAADPGRVFAELSYRPPGAAANVVAREVWRSWQLPVDVPAALPPEQIITPGDVLVGVVDGRFELRSARLGRPLHLTQRSSLALTLAPPLCRFLLDASANRHRHVAPFDWGRAAAGPFTPRLTRGALVVAPACWRLTRADADAAGGLDAWADAWMVPRHVHLTQDEGALLLDLRAGVSRAHLRRALKAAGDAGVVLAEALPAPGAEVLEGADGGRYTVEAVVPVVLDPVPALPVPALPVPALPVPALPVPAPPGAAPRPGPPVAPRTDAHRPHLPGGEWIALHLGVPAVAQDAFVTGPLAELTRLLAERFGLREVFFLRYADPGDEVRVRVRAGAPAPAGLRDAVAEWTAGLGRRVPLTDAAVRAYRPETDRYGGPELVRVAEELFAVDSRTATALLRRLPALTAATGLPRTALAAASLDRIALPLLPGLAERRALATALTGTRDGARAHRAHGAALWALRGRALDWADAQWDARAGEFGAALHPGARDRAVASLLHLHANRLGLRRDQETEAVGMWRRLLDREAAATRDATPPPCDARAACGPAHDARADSPHDAGPGPARPEPAPAEPPAPRARRETP